MQTAGVSPKTGAAARRDWTKGSIIGNFLSLAWPMVISNGLVMIGPTVDLIWVGRLGAASLAGVGTSGLIVLVVQAMTMGLNIGLRAMVARFVGAGDVRMANHVAQQSFLISIVYSLVMVSIGILLAESILVWLGLAPDVVAEGAPYLRINFIAMMTMSFWRMTEAVMQASGDSVSPMRIAIFFRAFHMVLVPFMIFGWWIFPRLGVTGAAITGVLSQGIGAGLGLWVLFSGHTQLRLTLTNFRIDPGIMWRLVKLAFPASITSVERQFGQLILMWFMTPFGTLAVAGHTLIQRIEFFMQTSASAMGQAAGVLVGQNLGAHQVKRAVRTGWVGAGFLSGCMLIIALAMFVWAEKIIGVFGPGPDVVELASIFLRIAAAGYFVLGLYTVFQHCMTGAGDTFTPMAISLLNMWLVQIPLAFFLPRATGLGVFGVRWAIVAGTLSAAIVFVTYFRSGRWQKKVI
ncbi:MAG: MATE family efflux transporter [Chloroflexi bacterium]|nr:MATE family efflux transporter [Chloroflexota bacterium]